MHSLLDSGNCSVSTMLYTVDSFCGKKVANGRDITKVALLIFNFSRCVPANLICRTSVITPNPCQ